MRRNLYRSAYSPVIYEAKDCSVGIFDAEGRLLGQAPHLGNAYPVKGSSGFMYRHWPSARSVSPASTGRAPGRF